ncbi:hypothetical protein LCGC14_0601820 [marine sediment metagenome]|uniref:Uncharacterized protein n=1 Tax=marine sediment metagenome TaxID=412755 RepID=A0A0F9RAE2_9ZZZZ
MKLLEIEECQECHMYKNISLISEFCINACHPKYDVSTGAAVIRSIDRIDPDCPLAEKEE